MHRRRWFVALLAAFSLVAAACQEQRQAEQRPAEVQKGGTFRAEMQDFVMDCSFDPTCEFVSYWIMVYSNVFSRTLMNYNHVAGEAGGDVFPDLAADMPEVSDDGLTYTFTLKDGVMFSPPVNREITSQDVAYAFQRLASQQQANPYTYYLDDPSGVIEGLEVQKEDPSDIQISGIETPDDKTIVFHLVTPLPDFLFRLALPATAPIPEEVASCFTESGEYGRFAISTGPYMLEGSDQLDITSCDTMEPISGFDPNSHFILVRNPSYDAATDTSEMRSSNPDGFEIRINTNLQDIFNKIEAGELETSPDDAPAQFLREYQDDRETLPVNSVEVVWYITMNMTQPPFDDIHVRKAANLAMDKEGLLRAAGGPLIGEISTHVLPPSMGGPPPEEYDPYPSPNGAGDVEAAMEEMRQSRYDTDQDGVCDAPECTGILHINRNEEPWTEFTPIIENSLSQIGIELTTREIESGAAYETIFDVSNNVPIASNAGWGKDWPDAGTMFQSLFTSAALQPGGAATNTGLVGLTPELNEERELGIEGNLENIPSVDADFEACNTMPLGDERIDCWNELDRKIMEDVVPFIVYRWDQEAHLLGPSLSKWEFDQNAGEMALAHIAVDVSQQA